MSGQAYTISEIKNIVTPIAVRHGVARVYLFGSYARGDATPKSDVDLRIDEGKICGLFELAGFHVDLEETLKIKVDVMMTDGLSENFRRRIDGEEVLIYGEQAAQY